MKRLKRFVAFILVFAVAFGGFLSANVAEASKLPAGSTIADISIEGLTFDEAKEKLTKEVENWKARKSVVVKNVHESFLIPRSAFQFNIDKTLKEMKDMTKRRWYAFFTRPKHVHLSLKTSINTEDVEWPDYIDINATTVSARQVAGELGEESAKLVYKKDIEINREKVSEVTFKIPDTSDAIIGHLVEKINETTIEPKEPFSFIQSVLEPLNISRSTEEVNFVATAFYALVLKSNIEMIERHSQGIIPAYSQAGVEAKVSRIEKKDLKLYNPEDNSYTVQAERRDHQLVLSLHSTAKEIKYNYRVENQSEIKPRTVYRYSSKLSPGQQQTVSAGSKGWKVEVYRDHLSDTGGLIESTLINRDFYPPTPTILLVASGSGLRDGGEEEQEQYENNEQSTVNDLLGGLLPPMGMKPGQNNGTNGNEGDANPFQEFEELKQQFDALMKLLMLFSILSDVNNINCDEIPDEVERKACEEIVKELPSKEKTEPISSLKAIREAMR